MRIRTLHAWFCLSILAAASLQAGDIVPAAKKDIYDTSADGSKQIADALALAGKDGKRVLLQFGANWCPWCHKLHSLCETDTEIAARLKSHYVVVLIDVDKGHNGEIDAKYGHPTKFGLPVLVVLDAEGNQLTTKDSGELEEVDHHSPAKVLAFLDQWSPKTSVGQPQSHPVPGEKAVITFNFQAIPLQQFLDCYQDLAGKKVSFAGTPKNIPALRATTDHPLTKSEALAFLEQVLKEQAGLNIVHETDGSLTAIQK
jgi:thiol-disulfide isomerase/thioredoxin